MTEVAIFDIDLEVLGVFVECHDLLLGVRVPEAKQRSFDRLAGVCLFIACSHTLKFNLLKDNEAWIT